MTDQKNVDTRTGASGAGSPASQQVSWSETHRFITEMVAKANLGPLPWAGTPAWCALTDDDPRKILALAAFGEHHALRIETMQTAQASASRQISAAANWAALAQRIRNRASSPYIPRRKSA